MGRTIKYFTIIAERTILFILGFSILYAVFFSLLLGEEESMKSMFCMMIFIMGAAMLFGVQVSAARLYIPVSISFGAKRSDTFMGIQIMNLAMIIQMIILIFVGIALYNMETFYNMSANVSTFVFGMLGMAGLGEILAAAILRFRKKGYFVIWILIICLCVGFGTSVGTVLENGFEISLSIRQGLIANVGIFGPVLYLIGAVCLWLTLRKYEAVLV